jgi:hypothetical protein
MVQSSAFTPPQFSPKNRADGPRRQRQLRRLPCGFLRRLCARRRKSLRWFPGRVLQQQTKVCSDSIIGSSQQDQLLQRAIYQRISLNSLDLQRSLRPGYLAGFRISDGIISRRNRTICQLSTAPRQQHPRTLQLKRQLVSFRYP